MTGSGNFRNQSADPRAGNTEPIETRKLQVYLLAGALAIISTLLLLLFLFSLGMGLLIWQRSDNLLGHAVPSDVTTEQSAPVIAKDTFGDSHGDLSSDANAKDSSAEPEAAADLPPSLGGGNALAEPRGGPDEIAKPSSSASSGNEHPSSWDAEQNPADENSILPGDADPDFAEELGFGESADAAGDKSESGVAGQHRNPHEFFVAPRGDARFFNIEAKGEAIAFVVDVSPSMLELVADGSQSRLDQLRAELIRSVSELSSKQRFTVIFFNSAPIIRRPFVLAQPGPLKVKELDLALQSPFFGQGTSPCLAMEFVLKKNYDVVFLLSDGEFDSAEVEQIRHANKRKTKICTIALGMESGNLRQIAEEASGEYRAVK